MESVVILLLFLLGVLLELILLECYYTYFVIAYLVQGFSFIKISKKLGLSGGFLGFVPGACYFQAGKMAEEESKRRRPEKKGVKWSVVYPTVGIVTTVLVEIVALLLCIPLIIVGSVIEEMSLRAAVFLIIVAFVFCVLIYFVIAFLVKVVNNMVFCIVFYKIYHVMEEKNKAIRMLLLSIFVPFAQQIILLQLAYSKKAPVNGAPQMVQVGEQIKKEGAEAAV